MLVNLFNFIVAVILNAFRVFFFQIPNKQNQFNFEIEGISVDLKTGTLTIAADNDEVVQNLTLAFSIAVLQVTVQSIRL